MIGCRSRADVATWRRRDVETSRRGDIATWQSLPCSDPHCSKLASNSCSFRSNIPASKQTPNQGSKHKNYVINIKKNVKMKDRREYSMSVLGTHHTPKLSFLLDLKQELTLNRTLTRHNATNTKTVLHMLKK